MHKTRHAPTRWLKEYAVIEGDKIYCKHATWIAVIMRLKRDTLK